MTESMAKAIPEGMHTVTPHIVVRGAARVAERYGAALDAEEHGRIPVPGGKLMSVELRFGDSAAMAADEFPEMGVLSPSTYATSRERRSCVPRPRRSAVRAL